MRRSTPQQPPQDLRPVARALKDMREQLEEMDKQQAVSASSLAGQVQAAHIETAGDFAGFDQGQIERPEGLRPLAQGVRKGAPPGQLPGKPGEQRLPLRMRVLAGEQRKAIRERQARLQQRSKLADQRLAVLTLPQLSLIHISEPTRQCCTSRMPSSA